MRPSNANILSFIKTIRDSFEGSELIYTHGSCFKFYLILEKVFPSAEPFYDEDHVITKIGNRFYDITGEVKCEGHLPMFEYRLKSDLYNEKHKASLYNMWMGCDNCGEIMRFKKPK